MVRCIVTLQIVSNSTTDIRFVIAKVSKLTKLIHMRLNQRIRIVFCGILPLVSVLCYGFLGLLTLCPVKSFGAPMDVTLPDGVTLPPGVPDRFLPVVAGDVNKPRSLNYTIPPPAPVNGYTVFAFSTVYEGIAPSSNPTIHPRHFDWFIVGNGKAPKFLGKQAVEGGRAIYFFDQGWTGTRPIEYDEAHVDRLGSLRGSLAMIEGMNPYTSVNPGANGSPGTPNLPVQVPTKLNTVIISAFPNPEKILTGGREISLTGGIIALGTATGSRASGEASWPQNVKITPDQDLLNGTKIPPVTPNIVDVRIRHYSVEAKMNSSEP